MSQLALAWVLRQPNVASAIVGASRPEQVDDNAAASGIELDEATLNAIDDAVAGVPRVLRGAAVPGTNESVGWSTRRVERPPRS